MKQSAVAAANDEFSKLLEAYNLREAEYLREVCYALVMMMMDDDGEHNNYDLVDDYDGYMCAGAGEESTVQPISQ